MACWNEGMRMDVRLASLGYIDCPRGPCAQDTLNEQSTVVWLSLALMTRATALSSFVIPSRVFGMSRSGNRGFQDAASGGGIAHASFPFLPLYKGSANLGSPGARSDLSPSLVLFADGAKKDSGNG